MGKYKRILLATDFSEQAGKALAEAVRLARKNDAELHVLYVDVIAQQNIEGFEYPPLPDYIRKVDQVAMEAVGRSVDVNYRPTELKIVRDTSEAAGILRYAAEKAVDLIVLGTHGRSAISEFFLGSVAQTVVRQAPVSVLIVGPGAVTGRHDQSEFRILAPVDFSPRSREALMHAGALAAERRARLVVLHVVDFDRVPHPEKLEPGERERLMKEQLARFVEAAALPVAAEAVVEVGPGAEVILRTALRQEADMIVLAPSSHSPLERLVLGSICKAVVRGAPCPVLIHHESSARQPEATTRVAA